jgi:hypothetical protein
MNKITGALLLLTFSIFLFSCGGNDQEKQTEKNISDVDSLDEVDSQFKEEFKSAVKQLPSPLEISTFIQETGAAYDRNIMNPYESVDKYMTTNQKKALNLGVYVADLGYSCAYYVQEDIIQYVNAVKVVSDQLGVSGAFGQDRIAKFEQSLPNKDSLIKVITENIYLTDEVLIENDKMDMAALILVGSFVEGLHISTSIVKNYPADLPDEFRFQILNPIITEIANQEVTLTMLLDILNKFEGNESVTSMASKLKELDAIYQNVDDSEDSADDVNADPNAMGVQPVLDKESLESITNKVVEIRQGIIS